MYCVGERFFAELGPDDLPVCVGDGAHAVLEKKLAGIGESVGLEKEWWEAKKASTKEDFMLELDEDEAAEKKG